MAQDTKHVVKDLADQPYPYGFTFMFVDVHTHLCHQKFQSDLSLVIERGEQAGLAAIVSNGLNPRSNRLVLELSKKYSVVKAALGIYPIDAVADMAQELPFKVDIFCVNEELQFIEEQASTGNITALGECGLDGHWLGEETFNAQEKVFERFIELSLRFDLPLIIHTRKREKRAIEILSHHGAKKVNFHCYGGRTKWALKAASDHGWYFSIPANARRSESFTKLLKELDHDRILTETDAPYLPPEPGTRNEPCMVPGTIGYMAELRGLSLTDAEQQVWNNYQALFRK